MRSSLGVCGWIWLTWGVWSLCLIFVFDLSAWSWNWPSIIIPLDHWLGIEVDGLQGWSLVDVASDKLGNSLVVIGWSFRIVITSNFTVLLRSFVDLMKVSDVRWLGKRISASYTKESWDLDLGSRHHWLAFVDIGTVS
jgi:hypothetical protein